MYPSTGRNPAMDGSTKYIVQLTPQTRERLESITRNGTWPAKKILHARVLLMSDEHHQAGRYHDHQIAAGLNLHINTVARIRNLYAQPLNRDEPLICMDEASKELHAGITPALPMSPGKPAREDDKYQRHGTRALFMFFAPLLGWRRVSSREHRTRLDWAQEIKR